LAAAGLFCAMLLCAQNGPAEKCSVSGAVVDSVTGQPLAKAQVRLQRVPHDAPDSGTATNAEGKFAMAGIEPGTYRLRASRNGYQGMFLGARRADSTGTTLTLSAGQDVTGLKITLQAYAVIAGTIRDSDGEALVGTSVQAFRWHFIGNKRRLLSESSVHTDDLGQYRIAELRPGKYLLRADPRPSTDMVDRTAGEKHRQEFDSPAYFPGVADWTAAVPVELAVGARMNGVDITVRRSPMFHIAGDVVMAQGVEGLPRDVRLREVKGDAMFIGPDTGTGLRPDGTFLFRNAAPGTYRVQAFVETQQRLSVGLAVVVVRDTDIDGVEVVVRPGVEVTGHVRMEGKSDDAVVVFDSAENSLWSRVQGSEHTYAVNLPPGKYTLGLGRGAHLEHAWLGSTDILTEGLTVGESGKLQLELVACAELGQVAGTAVTANGEPAAGATVVLVPEPRFREQTQRFQDAATDQHGRFLIKEIPPGEYKVLAFEDVEDGIWFDPDFLKKYEKAGEAVTIHAKQTESMKVTIR
jgi:5-hydroxyisourate hydrolase-like protein (transthyretin family)